MLTAKITLMIQPLGTEDFQDPGMWGEGEKGERLVIVFGSSPAGHLPTLDGEAPISVDTFVWILLMMSNTSQVILPAPTSLLFDTITTLLHSASGPAISAATYGWSEWSVTTTTTIADHTFGSVLRIISTLAAFSYCLNASALRANVSASALALAWTA